MQDFGLWLQTGFSHIVAWNGYDHILFLLVLCVPYGLNQMKTLLWLITAFTFGHSISLALSVMGFLKINSALVEVLIPLTILFTAIQNLLNIGSDRKNNLRLRYFSTGFFGMIHGMGFSLMLRSLLGGGSQLAFPLFAFNLGLEIGQVLILGTILLSMFLLTAGLKLTDYKRAYLFSGLSLLLALLMIAERFPSLLNT